MLDVYADLAEEYLAMPVIKGEKTAAERFPGAVDTLLHRGHDAGPQGPAGRHLPFPGAEFRAGVRRSSSSRPRSKEEYAWTTSWGVSTRLIGGLIMTHGDDDGLILPPRLAPAHVVLLPIFQKEDERQAVMAYTESLAQELKAGAITAGR